MKKLVDVRPEHLEIVRNILKKHLSAYTVTVWVFGSRARGTMKKFSDLDLAIDGDKSLPRSIMTELAFDFEESNLPYKVDIVDLATLGEEFQNIIEQDRLIIWKNTK